MDGISKKPMHDVIAPSREVARRDTRPATVPIASTEEGVGGIDERIAEHSFFKTGWKRERATFSLKKPSRRALIWLVAVTALSGVLYSVAQYFSRAIIEVTPITFVLPIDQEFIAGKDDGTDALSFRLMSVSGEKSIEVPATVEEKVERKASGTVIISNMYSSAPQKLIINTRLESPDHKIFRIERSVVVPGTSSVGGKTIPGTIEVVAYADAPGSDYNIGATDLTVPGLKGDPRYAKISARTKDGTPFSGGLSKMVKMPAEDDVLAARAKLKEALTGEMAEKIRTDIPSGVTFFPGSIVLAFEEVPRNLDVEEAPSVAMKATASVFFFDTDRLTDELAKAAPPINHDIRLAIHNMDELTFAFIDPVDNVVLSDLARVKFAIKGTPSFAGVIDAPKLAAKLVGTRKEDIAKFLVDEPAIEKFNATVRPFWNKTLPTDLSKIMIKVITN